MLDLPKEIVLFSSGWESTGCALLTPSHVPLVFFDYGQSYLADERAKVRRFALAFDRQLVVLNSACIDKEVQGRANSRSSLNEMKPSIVVPDRNLLMLRACRDAGANCVWMGTKNVHPLVDKYGDSNYTTLKAEARNLGIEVRLPFTMWPKFMVMRKVRKALGDAFVFCSEGIIP